MKIFRVGSRQFRESLRELLRELWVSYWSSRERPFREWNFVFREWNFQFRELLREYPGTLRELREWPFHSESVFPEIGVVPRLLKWAFLSNVRVCACVCVCVCVCSFSSSWPEFLWAIWSRNMAKHAAFPDATIYFWWRSFTLVPHPTEVPTSTMALTQQNSSITWCDVFRPKKCLEKRQKIVTDMTSWSLENLALLASRAVIISSQNSGRNCRGFFTSGDGC